MTAASIALALVAPVAIATAAPDLERVGAWVLAKPARPVATASAGMLEPRAVVLARAAPLTAVRAAPPAIRDHVVNPGETVFTIAARYNITPQTLAFNNGIGNTADLRPGQKLLIPPLDAAIHFVRDGETLDAIAASLGADVEQVRALNSVAFEPADVVDGRLLLIPVAEGRYPGFRLVVSDAPRVLAPRVRWPTEGIVTQLFSAAHTGIDIAAPYGSSIVAADSGTVSAVGWKGPGGLAVCVVHDWGLETCDYHTSSVKVEVGERVVAGQEIATVGSTGVSTGPHVHWEARTNGVLVDPMTYAPQMSVAIRVGGATGAP